MCERIPVAVDGSDTSNRVVDRPKWLPPAPIRPSQNRRRFHCNMRPRRAAGAVARRLLQVWQLPGGFDLGQCASLELIQSHPIPATSVPQDVAAFARLRVHGRAEIDR